MTMAITWRAASARRLDRQFLANPAPEDIGVARIASAMLGAHAQVLSAAELSLGLRTTGRTRADVRAALAPTGGTGPGSPAPADPTLVKTHGPRGTVHLLPAAELPLYCAALTAVPAGPNPTGLTGEQTERVIAAVAAALGERGPLTVDELSDEVVARTGPWAGERVMPAFQDMWPRWRSVLHRAGQSGALCFGPNRGRKVTYVRPPRFTPLDADTALAALVRRYLHAYGPATPRHFAKWLAAPAGWATGLFGRLAAAGEIEEVRFEDGPAWLAAGDTDFPDAPPRGVRLLPYFDAYAIAAQPRELLYPGPAHRRALAGGQAGNFPVLLVDGAVAGVWHQRRQGRRTTVTVEPLSPLGARRTRELGERVERVGEVLEARAELVVGTVTVGPHA
ncbi:winged helix DNA-binding domain-containing protein [Streptomyces sp. NPDC004610]|uniref:winged helix DNA-binding domain-containing protein n=1 Tax=unclassified Streptomyces TaxID=2593676 RepID=UPI0033A07EF0